MKFEIHPLNLSLFFSFKSY